ncbi:unnamed protein product [Enterobius vermicularis]|uniref:Secreted protein n=1 Tax=Enterobius vermicularis TaxID=51028 RepID=A0A0N4UWC4_ENTVE|nr:unnamed protein product [Enterobius vermicularis]
MFGLIGVSGEGCVLAVAVTAVAVGGFFFGASAAVFGTTDDFWLHCCCIVNAVLLPLSLTAAPELAS